MTEAADRVDGPGRPILGVVSGATMLVLIVFTVPLTTLDPTARALGAGPGAQAWLLSAGILNAALGRQAVATVPLDRTAMGSGVNNTARYLGSAIGITLAAILIAHGAEVGGLTGILAGWDEAVLVTAGFSILGAITVAAVRD